MSGGGGRQCQKETKFLKKESQKSLIETHKFINKIIFFQPDKSSFKRLINFISLAAPLSDVVVAFVRSHP